MIYIKKTKTKQTNQKWDFNHSWKIQLFPTENPKFSQWEEFEGLLPSYGRWLKCFKPEWSSMTFFHGNSFAENISQFPI